MSARHPSSSRPPSRESLRATRCEDPPPADLSAFWRATLDELASVAPRLTPQTAVTGDNRSTPIEVEATSLGGVKIRGWLSRSKTGPTRPEPRALLVTTHGYDSQTDPERVRRLGSFGIDVVSFDARGFGKSQEGVSLHEDGWMLTGINDPKTSILRGAVADYLQMARAARAWFGEPTRVVFQGFSFAGGLSTLAAGVLGLVRSDGALPTSGSGASPFPLPDLLAIGAPTFGDNRRRARLCSAGSGGELARYVRADPKSASSTFQRLSYFDPVHLAPQIQVRVIAGVGLFDPVVPAMTVYPILNALPTAPELFELPCSHTDRREEQQWIRWESAWIRAALGRSTLSASVESHSTS